jgi:outer membrane murein-binding lipoprotein Lpp
MRSIRLFFILISIILLTTCADRKQQPLNELESKMNEIAEKYVKLVLEIGLYKADYIDAYYGPEEWKPEKSDIREIDSVLISSLNNKTDELLNDLEALLDYQATEIEASRFRFLSKQLLSVKGIIFLISGGQFSFDQEANILYDAEPPEFSTDHFEIIINKLDSLLPGNGSISDRINQFRDQFIIPADKLDAVFTAAINESRKRSLQYLQLPGYENFKVEFVNNQPWGAYNWYKGNNYSIIHVNTDLPIYVDRAIDLAAHEGYPGHHVYNALLENNLVNKKGWVEYSVYPLFSPISFIAEGTANYGIDIAFPGNEQVAFEKEVLFPIAGLNAENADLHYKIMQLTEDLTYAGNEAARNYLDEKWTREETVEYLQKYTLSSKAKAEKKIDFYEKYRSYVINYNLGEDLVRKHVESNGGTADNPERRWELFRLLLTSPQTPSDLK